MTINVDIDKDIDKDMDIDIDIDIDIDMVSGSSLFRVEQPDRLFLFR